MSSLSRDERKKLIERGEGWKLADIGRMLFPIVDSIDITRFPALLALHPSRSEKEMREIKRRAIRAALRQGFKLPPSLQKEYANMTNEERAALRDITGIIYQNRAAIFSDETGEADEIAEAKRHAEAYAERVNGRSRDRAAFAGDDEAEARRQAEEFADSFNRRHGTGARR